MKTEKEIKDKIKLYRETLILMKKEDDIPHMAVFAVKMAKATLEWVLVYSEGKDNE